MALIRNNHVFKGHKTLLGSKYVTYGELELPSRSEIYSASKDGFDWGYVGSGPMQLAFAMLYQLSDENFSKKHASEFANDVVKKLNSRDWLLSASDVVAWIEKRQESQTESFKQEEPVQTIALNEQTAEVKIVKKPKKRKSNVVKDICKEMGITQKHLAEVLEVPEGTISSWAVKNEIPRLGKKAIEFYMLNRKNQEIVDSYKNFVHLLQSA